jgi:penicillin-binding protein 1A
VKNPFVALWAGRWLRRILIGLGLALLAGGLTGYFTARYIAGRLPPVDFEPPKVVTRIFDARGNPLHSVGEERRFLIHYGDISPNFIAALVAVEDSDFFEHAGFKPQSMMRGIITNLLKGKRPSGGSTLTMQLAKNYFLTPERTVTRKLKEIVLAMQLEKHYSKQQIFELYANKVNFGHARYGIEEASRFYFGKTAKELSVSEAALLAGVVQSPTNNSPLNHPQKALKRRNHVLDRMVETGKLDGKTAELLKAEPLLIKPHWNDTAFAPYFVDEVRRQAEKLLGGSGNKLMAGGLDVYTTLDPALQKLGEKAVASGLSQYERRHGFRRSDILNLQDDKINPKQLDYPEWSAAVSIGDFAHGVVRAVTAEDARISLGLDKKAPLTRLTLKDAGWTGCKKLTDCLKPDDLVFVRIKGAEQENSDTLLVSLEQEPDINASFVAVDNATGAIRAMVGGTDYAFSKFNRATQARRQTGSAIKPIVYAAAIQGGLSPATRLNDEPTSYLQDNQTCDDDYAPKNYEPGYTGATTMRRSLEHSINVTSVELLGKVGYKPVIALARGAGITAPLRPYPSLALGAMEISLVELTSAYTLFPMGGVHAEPFYITTITDREGHTLYQHTPKTTTATTPQVAAVTTELMRGVVQRGTAAVASVLGQPLAGKTGTTDDYSNAWFIGFTPTLTAGAWVGYDNPRSLGRGEAGAVAALPIWTAFMREARTDPLIKGSQFPEPSGLVHVMIDRRTGKRAGPGTGCREEDLFEEVFIAGTEPQDFCEEADHFRANLPWQLLPFDLSDGHLKISPLQLEKISMKYPGAISFNEGKTAVYVTSHDKKTGDHRVEIPFQLIDEPAAAADDMGNENWKCQQRTIVMNSKS